VRSAKPIRSGSLLIEAHSGVQASALLSLDTFMGEPVQCQLADRLNAVQGSVRSEHLLSLTNAELLEELQDQGVCQVQRLASQNLDTLGPNPTIRLSFHGQTLPQAIVCGYLLVPVSPWVPALPQCHNCWDIGRHDTRSCRQRHPTCGRCAQVHPTAGCSASPRCANCDREHSAWDKNCRLKQQARQDHLQRQQEARDAHLQRRGPGAATWPTLPPPGRAPIRPQTPPQAPPSAATPPPQSRRDSVTTEFPGPSEATATPLAAAKRPTAATPPSPSSIAANTSPAPSSSVAEASPSFFASTETSERSPSPSYATVAASPARPQTHSPNRLNTTPTTQHQSLSPTRSRERIRRTTRHTYRVNPNPNH